MTVEVNRIKRRFAQTEKRLLNLRGFSAECNHCTVVIDVSLAIVNRDVSGFKNRLKVAQEC
jgi:hypothetical protein